MCPSGRPRRIDDQLFDGCLIENPKSDSVGQVRFYNLLLSNHLLFCNLFDGCLMENQVMTDTTERGLEDCICNLRM